jgi:ABC-2 type transport system ATP-binding protein
LELLKVENITKSYGDHLALDRVSMDVPEKSIFGLLGPNGAGKTTLIRIITQILSQDDGQIFLKGQPITPSDVRKIGYLPEERGLYKKMKVGEQLLFLAGLKGLHKSEAKQKIKYWFDKLGADGWYSKKMEDLSKGMSQKVQFIATVMHDPDLIILDEPFSGFDPVNANLIKDNILELREKGTTVIFSTHRMESVEELCDHIAMINKTKKILDGSKAEIRESFKTNTFEVGHDQPLTDINGAVELLSSNETDDGYYHSRVKLPIDQKPNDLLKNLMDKTQINHFSEVIPSMNDIFISKVKGGSDE